MKIVQKYSDSRIRLINNSKNFGANITRNVGIENSHGKFIFFMDDDDVILPNMLETFVNMAEESQAEVVHMNSYFVSKSIEDTTLNQVLNPTPRFFDVDLPQRLHDEFINYGCEIVPWIKIQRRDFLIEKQIRFPETTREGDTLFHLAELCLARKILLIDGFGYVHRLHSENLMSSSAESQLRHAIHSLPIASEYMEKLFSRRDLISPLPTVNRVLTESHMIRHFFGIFILPSYLGELNPSQINDILSELVEDSEKRLMFNTISMYLIQLDNAIQNLKNRKEIF